MNMEILKLLNLAESYLKDNNIENPRQNAEILLCHLLNCKRIDLYLGSVILNGKCKVFEDLIKKRAEGIPLQYLLGVAEFMGLEFKISPEVFIPRPETELLVEEVLKLSTLESTTHTKLSILDLGTGSGNIAISLTKFLPECKIVAIDISGKALKVARKNARLHNVADRIEFLEGDLFNPIEVLLQYKFDIIVSNPPYIPSRDLYALPREVKYEPHIALDGGMDGIEKHCRIIKNSKSSLKRGGYLVMEMIGFSQAYLIKRFLAKTAGFGEPRVIKDYGSVERVIIAKANG